MDSNISYYLLWLRRFFFTKNRLIRLTPLISIFSLMLAVASLVLALSVYSGYETTIRQIIRDIAGHLTITYRPSLNSTSTFTEEKKLFDQLKLVKNHIVSHTSVLSQKSLIVHKGQLSGIILKGFSSDIHSTLNIKNRLIKGSFKLDKESSVVIGKDLATKWHLKIDDCFRLVVPKMNVSDQWASHSYQKNVCVEGIVDFGFYEFNSRLMLTNIDSIRRLIHQPNQISGVHLLVHEPDQIDHLRQILVKQLGPYFQVDDWRHIIKSVQESYLSAIRKEKFLIFFVLMVLVLAGAFNVSSHLSISVLNQIREISILKVMGSRSSFIFFLFILQGFLISLIGSGLGMGVGYLLTKIFVKIQLIWSLIPADVYKINTIVTDVRMVDIILIFVCSQVVCLLACVFPAWRALKLSIREGLICE